MAIACTDDDRLTGVRVWDKASRSMYATRLTQSSCSVPEPIDDTTDPRDEYVIGWRRDTAECVLVRLHIAPHKRITLQRCSSRELDVDYPTADLSTVHEWLETDLNGLYITTRCPKAAVAARDLLAAQEPSRKILSIAQQVVTLLETEEEVRIPDESES